MDRRRIVSVAGGIAGFDPPAESAGVICGAHVTQLIVCFVLSCSVQKFALLMLKEDGDGEDGGAHQIGP